jgi:Cu/Ag efflux pump CusA
VKQRCGGQYFRDDLDMLDEKAREVAAVLRAVPGNVDVELNRRPAPREWSCGCVDR